MKLKHLFIPLTGLALISLAGPSNAQTFHDGDDKVFPGSQCQPLDGLAAGNLLRSAGVIYHTDPNEKILVTCPILRDNDGAANNGFGVLLDGTAGQSIQCSFFSQAQNGSLVYSSTKSTDPNQSFSALFWDITANQTSFRGTYSITCELPALVFLLNYSSRERGDTNN